MGVFANLTDNASPSSSPSGKGVFSKLNAGSSSGVFQQINQEQAQQTQQDLNDIQQKFGVTPQWDITKSPLMQKIQQFEATKPQETEPQESSQPQDDIVTKAKQLPIVGPILRGLDAISNSPVVNQFDYAAGKAMGVPDNMMTATPQSTGSPLADKALQFIGGTAGYLTNPSQLEMNVGNAFFENPVVQGAGNRVGGAVNDALSRLTGANVSNTLEAKLLSKAAQGATVGGLGTATYAPFQTLIGGGNEQDIPRNIVEQGIQGAELGGLFGGAGGAIGSAGKALADKYAGTKIGDVLGRFFTTEPTQPEQSQSVLGLPRPGETAGSKPLMLREGTTPSGDAIPMPGDIYQPPTLELPAGNYTPPTRLKIKNPDEAFQSAYEKIYPAAVERMTPPLENPNELAKWVQNGLNNAGHEVSLNEVRQLSYEDLRTLGEEMRQRMQQNPYDVVRQTAHDMGYGKIFDQTAPTIRDRITQDAQKAVYGVPADRVNIKQPAFNITHENAAAAPETTFKMNRPMKPAMKVEQRAAVAEYPKMEAPKQAESSKSEPKEEALHADVIPEDPRLRDKVVSFMENQGNAARERIKNRRGRLSSNPVDEWADYAIIGAEHIVKGAVKIADFTEAMVREFGPEIKQNIARIYKDSLKIAKETNNQVKDSEMRRLKNIEKFAKNNEAEGLPNTQKHIASKTTRDPLDIKGKSVQTYIKTVDNLFRLHQLARDYEDITGVKLRAEDNAHTLGLNARGTDQIAHQIIDKNMVDAKGNVIGPSLKAIMKPIKGKQMYNDFIDYLINKHAVTRMQRGEDVFPDEMKPSPEKSQKIAENYEAQYPHFAKVAQNIYNFNKQLGESWLVDTGMISREAWDGYLEANPYYVPNNRLFSDMEKGRFTGNKGGNFANKPKPIKEATGSKRQIIDPVESMIEHVAQYVKTAKENEVMQTIVKYLEKEPEALSGWAQIVDKTKSNADQILKDDGIEGVINEINEPIRQAANKPDLTKGNIVTATVNGEKVHLKVNDAQLLEAVANLPRNAFHPVVNFFGQITRMMKALTTGFNPVFSLTRNVFYDVPAAFANSKTTNNPFVFARDLADGFISVLGHRDLYQSYKNMGGGHSSSIAANRRLLAQSKDVIIPKTTLGKVLHIPQKTLHMLENLNNAIESAPRLGEYKRLAKGGDYNSRVKGLYESNEVTLNFSRYGNYTKGFDSFIPYLNASVQGLDKIARTYFNKNMAIPSTIKSVAAITLPSVVLYAINHNDPNYQKLSEYTKDHFYLIPLPDGTFYKVPKPREEGVMFGSLVERSLREWYDHDPHAFDKFSQDVLQIFAPPNPLNNNVLSPFSDIQANKDFAGRPIVPGDLQKLSPPLQYDQNTSEVSKKIGKLTNTSPKQIDYLVKSYGGVVGQLGIPATSQGATIGKTLKQQVTADPLYSNDIISNFYDLKTKLDTAQSDFKATGQKSADFNNQARLYVDNIATQLTQIRAQIKKVQANPNLSDSARDQQIRVLQGKMNNVAQKAVQRVSGK